MLAARERQVARQGCANAHLDARGVMLHCLPGNKARQVLEKATERLRLSPRAGHRILKVARSIADLAGSDELDIQAVSEAIALRQPGRTRPMP